MSRRATVGFSSTVGVGLLVALAVTFALLIFPGKGQSGGTPAAPPLYRLSTAYDSGGFDTSGTQVIWTKSIPTSLRTFYVTVSGQAHIFNVDDYTEESLGCQIDGKNCAPNQWITVLDTGNNYLPDNSVIARWCMTTPPTPTNHGFVVSLQSSDGGDVSISNLLITVDATSNGACEQFGGEGNGG